MLFLTNGSILNMQRIQVARKQRDKVLQEKHFLSTVVLVHLSGKQQSTSKHSEFQLDM